MFWHEKPFTYPVCIPPNRKPFFEMTHEEAEAFFQWHQSILGERIDCLSSVAARELGISKDLLDLSPESLTPLWRWFLSILEIEDTPQESLDYFWEHDEHPEPFRAELLKQRKKQYTLQTELIMMDVAKYLGEVFVKSLPGIYWTYFEKPENDFFVKTPGLQGFADARFTPPFQMFFEPEHMTRVQAAHIWKGTQKEDDLFDLYHLWKKNNWLQSNP